MYLHVLLSFKKLALQVDVQDNSKGVGAGGWSELVVPLQPAHLMFVLLLERLQQTSQRKTTLTWKLDMERLPTWLLTDVHSEESAP